MRSFHYKVHLETVVFISVEKENTRKLEVVVLVSLTFLTCHSSADNSYKNETVISKRKLLNEKQGHQFVVNKCSAFLKTISFRVTVPSIRGPRVDARAPGVKLCLPTVLS